MLTGKYFKESKLISNDHRNGYFAQVDLDKVKAFLQTLESIAKSKNASVSQLVLRWTTLQPGITVVLAGARNATQAIENAGAMEITLSSAELRVYSSGTRKLKEPVTQ